MKEEKALGFHNVAFDCVNEVFLSYCHSNKSSPQLQSALLRGPPVGFSGTGMSIRNAGFQDF